MDNYHNVKEHFLYFQYLDDFEFCLNGITSAGISITDNIQYSVRFHAETVTFNEI